MKKLLALALVCAAMLSLAACGGKDDTQPSTTSSTAAVTTTVRSTIPTTAPVTPDLSIENYAPTALEKYGVDFTKVKLPEGCTFRDVVRNGNEEKYTLTIVTYHSPLDKAEACAKALASQLFEQTAAAHGGNYALITNPADGTQSKGEAYTSVDDCAEQAGGSFANASWGYSYNGNMFSLYVKPNGYYNTFEVKLSELNT